MPAQYVKPYVKTNKNDHIDAEVIAEAVGRANMRFVPIKSDHPPHACDDSVPGYDPFEGPGRMPPKK
jgi:hypothetical protein